MNTDPYSRLYVAAASPLVLRGVLDLLNDVREVAVVGSARDERAAFNAVQTLRPDMLLLDPTLAERLRGSIRSEHYVPRILLLGTKSHAGTQPSCGDGCACGFVSEQAPTERLVSSLLFVARCPMPRAGSGGCVTCPLRGTLRPPPLPLSEREYDVFVRIGWGQGPNDMAADLGLSVKTIEAHRESIKRKLGLGSGHELLAVALGWRYGYLVSDILAGLSATPVARTSTGEQRAVR